MKSLVLAPDLLSDEGGIARMLRLYLKALCELAGPDDSVSFVSLVDRVANSPTIARYSTRALVEYEVCNRDKIKFTLASLRMAARVDRIVCGHAAQLPIAWLASLIWRRKRYYLVAHGIEVWEPLGFLKRRAIRGAQRVFCVSEFTRQRLLEQCPMPAERLVVLPNALDPYLEAAPESAPPSSSPTILAVSRLSRAESYKGINHLIAAMPVVLKAIPNSRLRIIGRGDAMPYLQAQAQKLKLQQAVEFLGYRSDSELAEELDRCRLFALPSEKEGFGLVYLEAMARGKPCLGAKSGGAPEVITGNTGILVPYGDIPEISSALIEALTRTWDRKLLLERADQFSYLRFKARLASLLSA